ncbi:MAG: cytochrome c [Flavobacteriales bacterium]|nr:cytochrome c [Flavobacteriales bacterium]MDG1781838.1 cytochrome c [Flavobacteriales bacterium]MDG2245274.1 cytochrome c [Flavobacteriales bacterium]
MKHLLFGLVVLFLASCGNNEQPPRLSADGAISQAEVKRIYQMKCSICHGTDGKLMIGGAPDLSISTIGLEERIALITYGKETMPPQKDILSAAEIKAVAAYVENFRN